MHPQAHRTYTATERDAWKAEKRAEVSDLGANLKRQVAAMHDSATFQRWLRVQSQFHQYSFRNALLILMQRPDATRIAGYTTWQKLGRQVKKGEHGIRIFAPSPFKVTETNQRSGETDERTITAFRAVSVFDIGQTDGDDLPQITPPLAGDGPAGITNALCAFATREGLTLMRKADTDGAHGWYHPGRREVVLNSDDAPAQQCKTLIHELAHHLTHAAAVTQGWTRSEGETVAEGTAYIVCNRVGLDTSEYSFGYLASYARRDDATAIIEKMMATIQQTAHALLSVLEGNTQDSTEE